MRTHIPDSYERERISEATRALLCDFAAGDTQRPLRRMYADWEEVFRGVCRNGLEGLAFRYLRHWHSPDYPPQTFRDRIQEAHRMRAIRMALMYRKIGQVLARLTESGLDYMVVKGPTVSYSLYPNPSLRTFNDLDLVVRERDWAITHEVLAGMGFAAEENLAQPPPKFSPQIVLYEQKYWHRTTGMLVEVHYDDLLNAGLAARDVEGFWRRAVELNLEGVPVKTLSPGDQLIHLCAHAHYHNYTRLSWLSDLAFLIRDHGGRILWPQVIEVVRQEEAQVPVYYTLRFLQALLGVAAPDDVLGEIRPDRFRLWMHERFLPEDRVLSLQPMWRPDFSFYFLPLLKRLIPDLLVMGRRGDKLRSLLRLAVPSRAWLRHYYRIGDTSSLAIHYLLHPLKLAYHYLAEIGAVLLKRERNRASAQATNAQASESKPQI